jgi:hypothetical protein
MVFTVGTGAKLRFGASPCELTLLSVGVSRRTLATKRGPLTTDRIPHPKTSYNHSNATGVCGSTF